MSPDREPTGSREEPRAPSGARDGADGWTVDLHVHTSASYDCLSEPEDVLEAAREAGLDRVAITDHDAIEGALTARSRDAERVIVGEEVRTDEGLDLIGLFLHRRVPPGASFRETAEAIHAQGGLVYLPHPFDAHRGADEGFWDEVADCVDAVEGFNARVHDPERNRRARAWAEARRLPTGAGSDAHTLAEVGRARVRLPPFRENPEELLQSLRRGRLEGRASGRWVHLGSTWAKLRKRLP